MLITFSALDIFKLKPECGKRTKSWIFHISALTAPHKYGYGEYPVASPDMVSLGDISINMQGYARYPLVKAHGKETVSWVLDRVLVLQHVCFVYCTHLHRLTWEYVYFSGILMILAWCFFGTVGLLMTKYYKPMWPNKRFYGHRYWFIVSLFLCQS